MHKIVIDWGTGGGMRRLHTDFPAKSKHSDSK